MVAHDWLAKFNLAISIKLPQRKKKVGIRSYSGPYFRSISPYSVRMRENTDPNNSEYGHFSRSLHPEDALKFTLIEIHHLNVCIYMYM